MDIKELLKLIANPYILAAGGSYLAYRQYGDKIPKAVAGGGGAIAGYLLGSLVQGYLAKTDSASSQKLLSQTTEKAPSLNDYVDLNFSDLPYEQKTSLVQHPETQNEPPPSPSRKETVRRMEKALKRGQSIDGDGVFKDDGMGSYGTSSIDSLVADAESRLLDPDRERN